MYEEEKDAYEEREEDESFLANNDLSELTEGFDETKDFVWGSDQDEYIDES